MIINTTEVCTGFIAGGYSIFLFVFSLGFFFKLLLDVLLPDEEETTDEDIKSLKKEIELLKKK